MGGGGGGGAGIKVNWLTATFKRGHLPLDQKSDSNLFHKLPQLL